MRRRDFLKAFAALPLVGPLVASAAERPAKGILATTDSSRYRGYPKYGRSPTKLHALMRARLRQAQQATNPPWTVDRQGNMLMFKDGHWVRVFPLRRQP